MPVRNLIDYESGSVSIQKNFPNVKIRRRRSLVVVCFVTSFLKYFRLTIELTSLSLYGPTKTVVYYRS